MTAKEISELPGMPGTTQGVHKKAKRDGWDFRKQEGVKGPGWSNLISVPDEGEEVNQIQDSPAVYGNQFLEEFALIPGYRVQVSAGHGALTQVDQAPCRHLAFRRKWFKWRGFAEKELAIVWSKGDSMEPTISNNDTWSYTWAERARLTATSTWCNDDQLWVKRLQVLLSAWLLLSDNKHYQPIEVPPKDEQHTFEVIGQGRPYLPRRGRVT